ncbi:MAG: hypothetical protein ACJA17_000661 [Polaribacter sp.]|jgi:hypothetical protein
MRKLLILLLCICSMFIYGQEGKAKIKYSENAETKVTSLKYSSNSIKDLETIDFDEIKSIFAFNREDGVIKIIFEIDLKESKIKFKSSITVSGKTKELDSLIKRSKKRLNTLIRIAKRNKINSKL